MSKVRIRKYQLKAILEHMRDNMELKTIDDVINKLDEELVDDNAIAITFDDVDLSKVKEINPDDYEMTYVDTNTGKEYTSIKEIEK